MPLFGSHIEMLNIKKKSKYPGYYFPLSKHNLIYYEIFASIQLYHYAT